MYFPLTSLEFLFEQTRETPRDNKIVTVSFYQSNWSILNKAVIQLDIVNSVNL